MHSWGDSELGGIALTDTQLWLMDRTTQYVARAIPFAAIAKIQYLRGTTPNMIVVHYPDSSGQQNRHYLLFADTMIGELWSRELQMRLPQAG